MNRILVAEDEPRIASFIVKGLTAAGYTVAVAEDGDSALWEGRSGEHDLLVLDLGLPGRDGLSVLQELRRNRIDIPVVILTARDGAEVLVEGLDAGADDFISKPFVFDELLARIRTRLRPNRLARQTTLRIGALEFDLEGRKVTQDGARIDLSAREYRILETFLRHPGQVLSRQQLISHAWGQDFDSSSNIVDVYVGYLRRKLGPGVISTVRGMGYRMEDAGPQPVQDATA
ncbi:MAG TPA: response regulator transcription factor [Acidimicrobiales bacterium]